MDSTSIATRIAIKDLSLLSSPSKTIQSKEKLINMNSNTKCSSQLPRSKPTNVDPSSKTTTSATKSSVQQRLGSETSKLPSKYVNKKNVSNHGENNDSVNKTKTNNQTNSRNVSGIKPLSGSKIHRNTALSKTRNVSKSSASKTSSANRCPSDNDGPTIDELKVVSELNDKFRPRSDSESSHASHSSFCSQLSTSSVKSSICLPSSTNNGLGKTKKALTSSCSRLAVSKAETKMQKQPSKLSHTASSTTVTRASNSALSSASRTTSAHQTSRLRSSLGTENLQRAISTGSLQKANSKLSIPTGRSNLTTSGNKASGLALKSKKGTSSTSDLSASNRTLNKKATGQMVSPENLSIKHQASLGKSCENLSKKQSSSLQASCENLTSKVRSNCSSALSNHAPEQRSSLPRSKKSSLSRSASSSNSSLVQQREKSSSCASLAKDQRHTRLNGSTSSLPTAEKSDNKLQTNARKSGGTECKPTGIASLQGSKNSLSDKSQLQKNASKKASTTPVTSDLHGKKKTLPRATRNIGDQRRSCSTVATPGSKSSFGLRKPKSVENKVNKEASKIPESKSKPTNAKTLNVNDSNKTELENRAEHCVTDNILESEDSCDKTSEILNDNEEKLNEDNTLMKGRVSKNFAYDDYMIITDALSYENLSESDICNGDSDREDRTKHLRSPDKGLLRSNLSTSSLDISLHEDYVSEETMKTTLAKRPCNGDSDREDRTKHHRSPDKGLLRSNQSTSSLDISLHEDYVSEEAITSKSIMNGTDHFYQQKQEEFRPDPQGGTNGRKKDYPISHRNTFEEEKEPVVKCNLLNYDVSKTDLYSDKETDIYTCNLSDSSYQYQQQQQQNKQPSPPCHQHNYHSEQSKEFWSGPEEEEEGEIKKKKRQGVFQGQRLRQGGRKSVYSPETDIHFVNDRKSVLATKIKQGKMEEKGAGEEEEEEEEEEKGKKKEGIEEVVPIVGLKSADIYKTVKSGMPMPQLKPPLIGQYQQPENIIPRNEHTATGGCNLVSTKGSTIREVTEPPTETTDSTVASRKDVGTRRQRLVGGYEKENYPVHHKTAIATPTLAPPPTHRGGDKAGLFTQLVEEKEADSFEFKIQSRLDVEPIASLAEWTDVCDINQKKMTDPLRVQSKQLKFGATLAGSIPACDGIPCDATDKDNAVEVENSTKKENLLMEGPTSSELITRVRGPFLASEMGILGGQMLSPCSNDSSSFKDTSDDVVTPLSDVQEDFDRDEQRSDSDDFDSDCEHNNEVDSKHAETASTMGDSDSGSVVIEIEDSPLEASVGNEEEDIIIEEQDDTSEGRNYNERNSSFESDIIMGERPIVDAGEDLAEVTLDGTETQNLWLALEAESQYDNMTTCLTMENIAEPAIGEDVKELFNQSPNVEIKNNCSRVHEKIPLKKSTFYKEIPSQEFDVDYPDQAESDIEDISSMTENNSNDPEFSSLDDTSTDCTETLLKSSVLEICKANDSLHMKSPFGVTGVTADNFKGQAPKEMLVKMESQDLYLPDVDVNSNEDVLIGKSQISNPHYQHQNDRNKQTSYYDASSEITLDDSNFILLKPESTTKKSKDSNAQDFTLRQLQGTLNLRKQRILELCGQAEGTPIKSQKSPFSSPKTVPRTGRPTNLKSNTDTLCISPQSLRLSPSPTRREPGAGINALNSNFDTIQSSSYNSDDQNSPVKESWIKHEGKWKRGYILDDGKCIPTEEYKEIRSPTSPNCVDIQKPSKQYEDKMNAGIHKISDLCERPANINVDKPGDLEELPGYEEAPTPVARNFNDIPERLLFNASELISDDDSTIDDAENDCVLLLKTENRIETSQNKHDSVDGTFIINHTVVKNESFQNETTDLLTDLKDTERRVDSNSKQEHMDLLLKFDPGQTEKKSFSPEIVDDIPFVDMDYTDSFGLPSTANTQEPYSPDIKDVEPFSAKEEQSPKEDSTKEKTDSEDVPSLESSCVKRLSATRPVNLDVIPSVKMDVEPDTEPQTVAQGHLDDLPQVDFDKVLIKDSTLESSIDLENEPSVEPDSFMVCLSKDNTVPADGKLVEEQTDIKTDLLNERLRSETVKIKEEREISAKSLDKELTTKTERVESVSEKQDGCLGNENPKDSVAGNQKLMTVYPEEIEILHHELDNEQAEECDTPPADYICHSYDGSGTRTPVNGQSLTPVGSINTLLDKSAIGQSSFLNKRRETKGHQVTRPSHFEREIWLGHQEKTDKLQNGDADGEEEDYDNMRKNRLSRLQATSELHKSDQDLTKVGSLCDEIFSIIDSPNLLHGSWKTISSESSYDDASDMSSSQMESDDGNNRYSGRFSGNSSFYRNQSGSRSIYANIIRSSIHENSDSECSDYQDSCMMTKSAQDYENLKRTKEKANNKLKGRGYWSDENSPDSLLSAIDLYSDASEFAHACWSDRSTFGNATYQYSSPHKYKNDSSTYVKGAYVMKPEESHDIKLLAEISELDETFEDNSHSDCAPGGKISDPRHRSSLTVGEEYWFPVSSRPTRKPYRRSLSLPFATRDGEGGRAALLRADSEKPVNAGALGSPPELPSKVGRNQRKHNTVRRFSTQQSLSSSEGSRERYVSPMSSDPNGCSKAIEDLSPLHMVYAANHDDAGNGNGTDYKTVKKTTDRPASLDEIQLRAQFLDLRLKGLNGSDVTTEKCNGQANPPGLDHLQESFLHDPENGAMIQAGEDVSFLPPKSPGILRRMFRRGRSFSEKAKPLRPDEVMGPPKDSFVRKMSMKAIFRRSRSGSNSSQKGKEFEGLGPEGRAKNELNHRLSREMSEKGSETLSVPSTPISDEGGLFSNYSSVSMISSTGSTPPTSPAAYSVTFAAECSKDDVFEMEDCLSLTHDKNYNGKVLSLQLLRKPARQAPHMPRGVPSGCSAGEFETYVAGCPGSSGTYLVGPDTHSTSQHPVSPQEMEKLSAIVRGDMVSSNSSDSGIQHDSSLQSSNESLKVLNWLKDRHTVSLSKVVPEIVPGVVHRKSSVSCRERPKSDINVRWAQLVEQVSTFPEPRRRLREPSESMVPKPRPKSDLGGSTLVSESMKELLIHGKLLHSQSQKTISEIRNSACYTMKARRMSTPHPIKSRLTDRTVQTKLKKTLGRSFSMPENLNKIHKRRRLHPSGSDPLSDLHSHSTNDASSDESEVSMDYSLPDKCHSTRTSQLGLAPVDEIFEAENLTYAEALWDHVTMDPDELAFRAGDVIKVTDMLDKDWWWGILDDKEGWFPANFVRLRANQDHHLQETQQSEGSDPSKDSSPKLGGKSHQYSVTSEQARTNVINEIISAEREYVRQLDDVLQGYVVQAKKRPDMFPEDKTATIFGNLEDIYTFSKKFLKSIEISLKDELHQSEIGHCFIEHKKGFEIYSDYCNNHPHACDQLKELCKNKRYRHFFEGCRLLQEMKQIPLEGFLLTPVQKICKYPLQLAELLKYTSTEHPDYQDVCEALDAMKKIACLINERKRRMESIEKIAQWQATVEDWEGPDLLETSSELIYSGELSKVNSSGWTQERYFFLFDHQLIYCRKDILKKNSFSFRGRIYLDHSKISQVADGRDAQFNVYVKNGWKLHDDKRNKSFLVFSKNAVEKDRWLKAFNEERRKVQSDQENGFTIPANLRKSCVRNSFRKTQPEKPKEKLQKKNSSMSFRYQQELWKNLPAHATLPRGITNPTTMLEGPPHPSGHKKRSWFSFTGKKSKR